MSGAWVRSGVLVGAGSLITELGGEPEEVCRLAGVSPKIFDDPDMPVASAGVVAFLAQAAQSCRCPTFGLRLASRQDLSVLGPLWLLMRSADMVAQLIADLARYYVIHTRGSSVAAMPAGDGSVFVTYHLAKQSPIDDRQVIELGMALFCNEMRSHAEANWQPASVQFCHRAPDDLSLHRRFFGPTLAFDQDRNAVRIQADLLARPLAAADERSRRMMSAVLAGRQSRTPQAALSRIEGAIRALMPFSDCSIGEVAATIASSPRTLQRQLAENGTTFQKLRDQIRSDLALKYLRQSTLQLGEISEILGFAEPSVFTRSFRRWHGCTPRDARRRIAEGGFGAPSGRSAIP
ncbi:MAG: AraC family transcriptional regulator [Burkholderiales bacterium]|nr:AraC family transcriptional regulator [Burkholderiales bacterium]